MFHNIRTERVIVLRIDIKPMHAGLAVLVVCLVLMCGVGFWRLAGNGGNLAASAGARQIPVYCVETQEPRIAISFDVATGTDDLQQLLDILEKREVHATFFMVGSWIRKWPDQVKQLYESGHELANHANHHVDMTTLDTAGCMEEIRGAQQEVSALTGYEMNLFRPPYGAYNNQVIEAANQCGYITVQWSVDSLDWKELPAQEIAQRVTGKVQPGSIVLFHNAAKHTPEALPSILTALIQEGYTFVPISQIILDGEYTIDHTGRQCPA